MSVFFFCCNPGELGLVVILVPEPNWDHQEYLYQCLSGSGSPGKSQIWVNLEDLSQPEPGNDSLVHPEDQLGLLAYYAVFWLAGEIYVNKKINLEKLFT